MPKILQANAYVTPVADSVPLLICDRVNPKCIPRLFQSLERNGLTIEFFCDKMK